MVLEHLRRRGVQFPALYRASLFARMFLVGVPLASPNRGRGGPSVIGLNGKEESTENVPFRSSLVQVPSRVMRIARALRLDD